MNNLSEIFTINSQDEIQTVVGRIVQNNSSVKKLIQLIELLDLPLTIILENYYVDKVYRDMYYRYYSNKHFMHDRNCKRISIFEGIFNKNELYNEYTKNTLNNKYVGSIVIRPLKIGELGRTLINPTKLKLYPSYIRTTTFTVEVLGMLLTTEAFPFSEQDAETMTCAETTVWAITEYYGTRYPEYKVLLPSEILTTVDDMKPQRILPSYGLDYYTVSKVLKKCGFQPRLYSAKSYSEQNYKKIFHYYVESGIPIGVGTTFNKGTAGHSTVCIGHASSDYALNQYVYNQEGLYLFNSCNFHNSYVMIDDNQIPYSIEKYGNFTLYDNAVMNIFVIPLYKRILLEADKADILFENIVLALANNIQQAMNFYKINNSLSQPIFKRIFLTSSRKYKAYRVRNASSIQEADFYGDILFPKFLWIMELSSYDLYKTEKIWGEIILDATSAQGNWEEYIIAMRLFDHIGYRLPDETFPDLLNRFQNPTNGFHHIYDLYKNNLKRGNDYEQPKNCI